MPDITQQGRVRFVTPVDDVTVESAVIAQDADTTGNIDTQNRTLVGIQMPAVWTAASLTFDGSFDGTTFVPIHYGAGAYTINAAAGAAASLGISLNPEALKPWPYVRIRSGVIGTYVDQLGAARTLRVFLKAG